MDAHAEQLRRALQQLNEGMQQSHAALRPLLVASPYAGDPLTLSIVVERRRVVSACRSYLRELCELLQHLEKDREIAESEMRIYVDRHTSGSASYDADTELIGPRPSEFVAKTCRRGCCDSIHQARAARERAEERGLPCPATSGTPFRGFQ